MIKLTDLPKNIQDKINSLKIDYNRTKSNYLKNGMRIGQVILVIEEWNKMMNTTGSVYDYSTYINFYPCVNEAKDLVQLMRMLKQVDSKWITKEFNYNKEHNRVYCEDTSFYIDITLKFLEDSNCKIELVKKEITEAEELEMDNEIIKAIADAEISVKQKFMFEKKVVCNEGEKNA